MSSVTQLVNGDLRLKSRSVSLLRPEALHHHAILYINSNGNSVDSLYVQCKQALTSSPMIYGRDSKTELLLVCSLCVVSECK